MLSIIIPTYNEVHTIGHLLKYLWFDQRLMDAEVIVVDGGSTDGTCERVEEFPMVRLIRSSRKGRSFQLHLGAKLAKGDFCTFFMRIVCRPKVSRTNC